MAILVSVIVGTLMFLFGAVFGAWIMYELEHAPIFQDPNLPDPDAPTAD